MLNVKMYLYYNILMLHISLYKGHLHNYFSTSFKSYLTVLHVGVLCSYAVRVCNAHGRQKKGAESLGSGDIEGSEVPSGCRESNQVLLKGSQHS